MPKAIQWPLGDQAGEATPRLARVRRRTFLPSARTTYRSPLVEEPLVKAIRLPLGDHAGASSSGLPRVMRRARPPAKASASPPGDHVGSRLGATPVGSWRRAVPST